MIRRSGPGHPTCRVDLMSREANIAVRAGGDRVRRHAVSLVPDYDTRLAELRLLALTDSFHAEWPGLAAACGLTLVPMAEPAALEPRKNAVTLVAAAGGEALLPAALGQIPQGNRLVGALGADADHRLPTAVLPAGAD